MTPVSTTLGNAMDAIITQYTPNQTAYLAELNALTAALQAAVPSLPAAQAANLAKNALTQTGGLAWRVAAEAAIQTAVAAWESTVLGGT